MAFVYKLGAAGPRPWRQGFGPKGHMVCEEAACRILT